MPVKTPWYSATNLHVHHNNTSCTTGNNIERRNMREGTGNLPLCQECGRLS